MVTPVWLPKYGINLLRQEVAVAKPGFLSTIPGEPVNLYSI